MTGILPIQSYGGPPASMTLNRQILNVVRQQPATTAAISDILQADYGAIRDKIGEMLKANVLVVCGYAGGKFGEICDKIPLFDIPEDPLG